MKEMDKILDYLKQLELSDEESTLYITLLQTGPVSVKSLAEEVDIKRTTSYIYINTLVQKGLIVKVVKGAQKMVAANDPKECLEDLVKRKIQKAEAIKKNFSNILSAMTTSMSTTNDIYDAEIRYYKGGNGAKKIYEEAFQASELRTYVFFDKNINLFPDSVKVFNSAFKNNPKLKIWEMIYDYDSKLSTEPAEHVKLNINRYFYKLIPNQLKLSSEDILIYDGKVAILNFREGGTSIVLNSIDFYSNFKALFDFIWKLI